MDNPSRGRRPITIVPTHRPTPTLTGAAASTNGFSRGTASTLDADARAATEAPTQPRTAPVAPAASPTQAPEAPRPSTAPAETPPAASAPPQAPASPEAPARKKRGIGKRIRNLVIGVLALAALATAITVGYRWYEDSITYVSTDNAQISGPMIQVGGLEAGRVINVRFDVGDHVNQGDVVGQLSVPMTVSVLPNGTPNQQFTGTNDATVDVRSPVSGVVVARVSNPGDTVPAGQPILTVVNPNSLWVMANVEETQTPKLHPGQAVQIHVDNLNADLSGHVAAISQASAQSFSAIPQQNLSGNYTKVTQLQPVKIVLDQTDPRLAIGTSVEVKINVAS